MTKEELLKRKEKLEEALDRADKRNDLLTCIQIGKVLNEIDKKIRDLRGNDEK